MLDQLDLKGDYQKHKKQEALDNTVMALRRKFGDDSIFNCCLMTEKKMPRDGKEKLPVFKINSIEV